MRRTICGLMAMALLCATAHADPARAVTVDYTYIAAPSLLAYRANGRTFDVTVKNAGTVVDLTNHTPAMWYATSNTASSVVTASCSVVSATAGTFRATFSAAALNSAPGNYVYGIGLTSGTYSTARQGVLVIVGDPYASGATPLATSSTNVTISLYGWTGTFPASSIPATTATLADILANGNNANAVAITNAAQYGLNGVVGGMTVDAGSAVFTGNRASPTAAGNIYSASDGLLVLSAGTDHASGPEIAFYGKTLAGVGYFSGSTWNWEGMAHTNAASVAIGSGADIVVITGRAALSNFVQSVIDAQP